MNRRTLCLSLAATAIGPITARAADATPIEFVNAIYRRAAAGKGDRGGEFLWRTTEDRRANFTRRTVELWDRADRITPKGDIGPIEFDPVVASQDPELKSFVVTPEEDGPERARLAVALSGRSEPKPYATVRFLLSRESGRWRIDDITGSTDGETWSLRALMQGHIDQYRTPQPR